MIKVLIVEDQLQILEQQKRLLQGFDEIEIVATARNGQDALEHCKTKAPDIVLLDLGLPDIDGIEVTKKIKSQWPKIEILIFTIFDDEDRVLQAVRAGASGYLLKGVPADRIVEALKEVIQGGSIIQPQLARALLRRFQQPKAAIKSPLTPRESEILTLIAKGLSNRGAAESLNLSRATIRTHLEHIYAKLEVSNRTEAVTEAIRLGIIDP